LHGDIADEERRSDGEESFSRSSGETIGSEPALVDRGSPRLAKRSLGERDGRGRD
jgi:hypothetical protein